MEKVEQLQEEELTIGSRKKKEKLTKIPKSKEERVKEVIEILKKLKEAGVNQHLSYQDLKKVLDEWIQTGEAWSGKIPFPEYGRVAELTLPKYSKHIATMIFRLV